MATLRANALLAPTGFEDAAPIPIDQLPFTSHDATLLYMLLGSERVLDRGTLWLTEKRSDGATELYPVTSISPPPRKEDNLFRKYLLGHYGGIPHLSSGTLTVNAGLPTSTSGAISAISVPHEVGPIG